MAGKYMQIGYKNKLTKFFIFSVVAIILLFITNIFYSQTIYCSRMENGAAIIKSEVAVARFLDSKFYTYFELNATPSGIKGWLERGDGYQTTVVEARLLKGASDKDCAVPETCEVVVLFLTPVGSSLWTAREGILKSVSSG